MDVLGLVMRAVSGSGKSTLARSILAWAQDNGVASGIVSTDDLFVVDGVYRFEPSLLTTHHAATLERFHHLVRSGVRLVVIDNTNLHPDAIAPYCIAARNLGAQLDLVELLPSTIEFHVDANSHGVPMASVKAQLDAFKEHQSACHSLFEDPPLRLSSPPTENEQAIVLERLRTWLT